MNRSFRILIFLAILIWCAGIFSEWLIPINQTLVLAIPFLEKSYSLVCHQLPERLIKSDHYETLVCARCSGIYIGLLICSFASLFIELKSIHKIKYLFYASIPLAADVIFHTLNIYHYSKTIAFSTGILLGSTGFLYLYSALNQLFAELKSNRV